MPDTSCKVASDLQVAQQPEIAAASEGEETVGEARKDSTLGSEPRVTSEDVQRRVISLLSAQYADGAPPDPRRSAR